MKKLSFGSGQSSALIAAAFALSLLAFILISASTQSRAVAQSALYDAAGGTVVFPRATIIQWDDTVARFDTATGAVHRFSGQLHNPPTKAEWFEVVPAVRERTSGMLRFQQPEGVHAIDAPFLVDVVTGDTWILRNRHLRPRWDRVEIVR